MTALVLGSATILGLFITLAAWLNGRSTKKVIKEMSQQTQELIKETNRQTQELIKEENRLTRESIQELIQEEGRLTRELIAKISEQIEKIPEKTAYFLRDKGSV